MHMISPIASALLGGRRADSADALLTYTPSAHISREGMHQPLVVC